MEWKISVALQSPLTRNIFLKGSITYWIIFNLSITYKIKKISGTAGWCPGHGDVLVNLRNVLMMMFNPIPRCYFPVINAWSKTSISLPVTHYRYYN